MTISIIIAVKAWQKNLEECINKCRKLDYPDLEIIVLPDSEIRGRFYFSASSDQKNRTVPFFIVPTGCVSPAKKRDMALSYAKGDILAFIDDDAYPREDWLENALKHFADPEIAAVGGPAVTPPEDSAKAKASGLVYASVLVSWKYAYRYLPKKKQEVYDYPSCNFLVRASIMRELGGFKTNFWPGEDTKLCLDITKRLGKKIIYDPDVVVFHHRRHLFIAHLKQVASYALHRGYFAREYPQTSLKIAYFIPSIFVTAVLIGGIASLIWGNFRSAYLSALLIYISIVFISSISGDLQLIPLVFPGIILTHIAYGLYFLKGLISRRLKSSFPSLLQRERT